MQQHDVVIEALPLPCARPRLDAEPQLLVARDGSQLPSLRTQIEELELAAQATHAGSADDAAVSAEVSVR